MFLLAVPLIIVLFTFHFVLHSFNCLKSYILLENESFVSLLALKAMRRLQPAAIDIVTCPDNDERQYFSCSIFS
jgi:hypothetical protein